MALSKITADSLGANAVTANAISNTAIIAAVGYTPANKAGDTFTGNVVFSANATITGAAAFSNNVTITGNTTFSNTVAIGGDFITPHTGFKNRIINGDMRIAQRGTASISVDNGSWQRPVDKIESYFSATGSKFTAQQNAGAVTPPVGFTNYVGITSTSAYTVGAGEWSSVRHLIEGFNVADLMWGTANAQPITLSFWVRSSLTGTHGGAIYNGDGSRSYPFTYTINAANTWEYETITIPGDTSGTWNSTNGPSITPSFSMGTGATLSGPAGAWAGTFYASATGAVSVVGTNGATWYMTGLQLEKGSTATAFEYRDFGRELILCQRYYEKSYDYGTAPGTSNVLQQAIGLGIYTNTPAAYNRFGHVYFKVAKRAGPTVTLYAPATGSSATASNATSGDGGTNIGYCQAAQVNQYGFNIAASVGGSTNTNYYTGFFAFTAEAEL